MADGLPAELGDAVLHAARLAFTDGLHLAAIAAMVAMLLGAVTALVALRGARPGDPAVLAADPVPAPPVAAGTAVQRTPTPTGPGGPTAS